MSFTTRVERFAKTCPSVDIAPYDSCLEAMATHPFKKVLIVGAGPSGLLLALLLSKHGIPVTVVEMSAQLDQEPRAAHYGPPAIPDLQRAGILEHIKAKGLTLNTMCWRRSEDHSYIAGFDAQVLSDVDGNDWRTVSYPLQDLDQLMLDHFVDKYNGDVRWLHKVLDVGQDAEKAWVDVETPEGKKRIEADYIVGCDGANSAVRRSLFGSEFPGFTWDAQIIATNVSITTPAPPFPSAERGIMHKYDNIACLIFADWLMSRHITILGKSSASTT